jgi:hypothetical protein
LLLALYQGLASAKPKPNPIFPKIKYAAKPRSNPAPAPPSSRSTKIAHHPDQQKTDVILSNRNRLSF